MTPDTLQKLEDAFSNALPDKEACLYAGIAPQTLYNYQERNPAFLERKEALKLTPNIAALKTIVSRLGEIAIAQWWVTKKMPDEFGNRTKLELAGKLQTENIPMSEDVRKAVENFEEEMRKVMTKPKELRPQNYR